MQSFPTRALGLCFLATCLRARKGCLLSCWAALEACPRCFLGGPDACRREADFGRPLSGRLGARYLVLFSERRRPLLVRQCPRLTRELLLLTRRHPQLARRHLYSRAKILYSQASVLYTHAGVLYSHSGFLYSHARFFYSHARLFVMSKNTRGFAGGSRATRPCVHFKSLCAVN